MKLPRHDIESAARKVLALPGDRQLIAVAGPPGAGKSTLSASLCGELQRLGQSVAVVPMDGFHLDNGLLEAKGLLSRKGAPETFDGRGFVALVRRIAAGEPVYVPIFDRTRDISIASAAEVTPETRFVLFEGNYLLCDMPPWDSLLKLWSFTVFVDPGPDVIRQRLLRRWLDMGLPDADARRRRDENDLPNAEVVVTNSVPPDLRM